jgi:Arc/MetJ-type ribon-helix-helix transcriptional regulator
MKLSVSLSEDDVALIDEFVSRGAPSRSAVLHNALQLLRATELESAYAAAADEWAASEDAHVWDGASADGLADAPR